MIDLRVIEGGKASPPKKFSCAEMHPDDGVGFYISMHTGEVVMTPAGAQVCDTVIGWHVDDRAVAQAFVDAMNDRYERDMAEIAAEDLRLGIS